MERRHFLTSLAAGLPAIQGLTLASAAQGQTPPTTAPDTFQGLVADLKAARDEAAYWSRVRQEFLLNPGLIHLNTGTLGAVPRRVLEAVSGWMYELEGDPASNVFGPLGYRMENVRAKAAEFLGATLEETAIVENTTSGMNAIAQGLSRTLKPGDEILTTNHEHPGGLVCWEYLAKHYGVKIVQIPMPAPVKDKAQILQLVEDHITPRTKVCSFSHVETITGLRMPLADISALTRPRGILLVCDGAQAPGMLKIDVKALGVDTYASSSHKWMLAPKGSGLLYIRKEAQDRINPMVFSTGYGSYTAASGTRDVPHVLGHGVAMDFHNTIGRDRVEERCKSLSKYFRERLAKIRGLKLLTPTQSELTTGIVTFGLERGKNSDLYTRMHNEHNITIKVAAKAEYNAIRLSTHVYNREDDLDRAADLIEKMLPA